MATLLQKVKAIRHRLSPLQLVLMGTAALVLLIGAFILTRPAPVKMATLFSGLDATDASAITTKLDAEGVAYTIADDGSGKTTIKVPADKVYTERISLSAAGMPSGGKVGYSLLDNQSVTASEFNQRVSYQRALEGELAKTIASMNGVADAQVHLVLPKDSAFADAQGTATASVLITPKGDAKLTSSQVAAVRSLVASSVPSLTGDQVTITDTAGHLLAGPGATGGAGSSDDEARVAYETQLTNELHRIIDPIVGASNAQVRVNANLDFASRKTTSERFDTGDRPEGPVTSEATTNETYTGTGAATGGGTVGPDGAPIVDTGSGNVDYQSEKANTSRAVNRTVTETTDAPGTTVRRLDVAIVLNDSAASAEQAQLIQQLATAAVGANTARGDTVVVGRTGFSTDGADQGTSASDATGPSTSPMTTYAVIGGVLAALLVAGFVAWRHRRRVEVIEIDDEIDDDVEIEEVDDDIDELYEPGDDEVVGADTLTIPEALLEGPPPEYSAVRELVERQPDEMTAVLRDIISGPSNRRRGG